MELYVIHFIIKTSIKEFEPSSATLFEKIKSVECMKHIELSNLTIDGVESMIRHAFQHKLTSTDQINTSLSKDVYQQSQGIPFVVKVLTQLLIDDPNIKINDGYLERDKQSILNSSSSLPKDATTAVVAQFDKLSKDMKQILRVAAISGLSTISLGVC